MKVSSLLASAASAAVAVAASSSIQPVEVRGNALYVQGSNDRFYIRGVDYQPGGSSQLADPLADTDSCKRDVQYFQQLGINAIRVYTVFNNLNHDECMQALADAGIYLILDVNTPQNSINRADPGPSYNAAYLQTVFATIDAFKNYENTLMFFAANEVMNQDNTTDAAPYIKAVVRDMKSYMKAQSKRQIPVAYSAADIDSGPQQLAYLTCQTPGGEEDTIDVWGLNCYRYCGAASSFQAAYAPLLTQYQGLLDSTANFFSEFGCNTVHPRTFPEVSSLYSDQMGTWSGGCVYEYTQEANDYGLVSIDGSSVSTLQDFNNLKSALASVSNPSGANGAVSTASAPACPAYSADVWLVKDSDQVPALPSGAEQYIKSGAGKPLGTGAPWTQNGDGSAPAAGSGSPSGSGAKTGSGSATASTASATHSKSAATGVQMPQVNSMVMVPVLSMIACFVAGMVVV